MVMKSKVYPEPINFSLVMGATSRLKTRKDHKNIFMIKKIVSPVARVVACDLIF